MIKNINLQFLISYLGLFPFLIALADKFFFKYLSTSIVDDFIIIYSLIIFVFIGAINWDLKKIIPIKLVLFGFLPSLIAVILLFMHLMLYEVHLIVITFIILQLLIDNFIYKKKFEREVYLKLRLPLTILIVLNLVII
tara:strand:- start:11734 stop:12147 length:414 start_codon:yes stop_codon:yes gene_type:complete